MSTPSVNSPSLQARVPEAVSAFLQDAVSDVLKVVRDQEGPVHIAFPGVMRSNIEKMQEVFSSLDLDYKIHFAHKPTKSTRLIREAFELGIGIDVASLPELEHALAVGFTGDRIECTGAKSRRFIQKALAVGALMSVDSISELEGIVELSGGDAVDVLIRIADPTCSDRNKIARVSRFGVPQKQLPDVYALLDVHKNIRLKGFHFHNDERDADVKAEYVLDMLRLIQDAVARGHAPDTVNMGGGWRGPELEDFGEWSEFLNHIELSLIHGGRGCTWRDHGYGMYLNDKGRVSGREKIQGKFVNSDLQDIAERLFDYTSFDGAALRNVVADAFLSIMTEPGYYLMDQVGVSFAEVIAVAEGAGGVKRVVVNANMYNFSTQMREMFLDPKLIKEQDTAGEAWEGYIVGNLCREEDILMKRSVRFDAAPEVGDVICFMNTAGYTSSFEEASPHMHAFGDHYWTERVDGSWVLHKDTQNV